MSDVLNRVTGQFLKSVNTPDFPTGAWIINPDLSAVIGQPTKYWIIDPLGSNTVRLATAPEQTTIDNAIAAIRTTEQKDAAKNRFDTERVLIALLSLLPGEFNTLRTLHALPDRTPAQLRTAIRNAIDAAP